MARKPKAARSNDFAASPEQVLAVLGDAPAPARGGRKPKAAAAPGPVATLDSDDAVGGSADADAGGGGATDPGAAPARKRPGPKPKRRAGAVGAAPLHEDAEAKPGQETPAPGAAPEPVSAADEKPDTETGGRQDPREQPRGPGPAAPAPAPASATSSAAPSVSSQDAAASVQPAARWDRTSDTVSFDWPAIERTATQNGPNQAMAKLLVAARAEGATSRWPL